VAVPASLPVILSRRRPSMFYVLDKVPLRYVMMLLIGAVSNLNTSAVVKPPGRRVDEIAVASKAYHVGSLLDIHSI